MELYVIKCGQDYVRACEDHYILCGLNKASVFSPKQRAAVEAHLRRMRQENNCFAAAAVYKLAITETPLGGISPQTDER